MTECLTFIVKLGSTFSTEDGAVRLDYEFHLKESQQVTTSSKGDEPQGKANGLERFHNFSLEQSIERINLPPVWPAQLCKIWQIEGKNSGSM